MFSPTACAHPVTGRRRALLTALLAGLLLTAACTATRPKIEAPGVTVERVRILGIAEAQASIRLTLHLTNHNSFELPVEAVDLDVTLDERSAASVQSLHVDPLPAGGEANVELAGRVDVAAVATALMTFGAQMPVGYTLKGSAKLRDGTVLPFSAKGQIPVARFERALGGRP